MTTETTNLIVQILSVLLVCGSLIFVGLQMRQTYAIKRANAQRHLLTQWQEWQNSLTIDPSVFADVRDCMHGYAGSPALKRQRFFAWAAFAIWICEQGLYQSRDGSINKTSFDRIVAAMVAVILTPGGRQWWAEFSLLVGDDIREYPDDVLAASAESLPPPFYKLATHYDVEAQGARP